MGIVVRKQFGIGLLAFMLAGCGNAIGGQSQDFAVTIARPPATLLSVFSEVSTEQGALIFPGLKVDRTKPDDRTLLYTIPSSGSQSSRLRLEFAPVQGGKATELRAFIDVPPITATIDGKPKVVSETKVENELEKILKRMRDSYASQAGAGSAAREISELLVGVAVATDHGMIRRALDGNIGSAAFAEMLGAVEPDGPNETAESAPDSERALAMQNWREQRAAESASAPTADLAEEEEPASPEE